MIRRQCGGVFVSIGAKQLRLQQLLTAVMRRFLGFYICQLL